MSNICLNGMISTMPLASLSPSTIGFYKHGIPLGCLKENIFSQVIDVILPAIREFNHKRSQKTKSVIKYSITMQRDSLMPKASNVYRK